MVLDPRHMSCPACFDGTQEGRNDEWRFQLVACLAAVDARFGDVAANVARRTTSYSRADISPDEEGRKASCSTQQQTSALDHANSEP